MYDDYSGTTFIVGCFAAITLGGASWFTELQQDARVKGFNQAAAEGCISTRNLPNKAALEKACREEFAYIAQHAEDADTIGLKEMSTAQFKAVKAQFLLEARGQIQEQERQAILFPSIETKLQNAVRAIDIDGARVFQNANVDVVFESIAGFKDARGQNIRSGKWNVNISDPGSNASRTFSYDYATGKATGPSGSSDGFTAFRFQFYGLLGGPGKGTANTLGTNNNDLQDCKTATAERACMVADVIHRALNGYLPNGQSLTDDEIYVLKGMVTEAGAPTQERNMKLGQGYFKAEVARQPEADTIAYTGENTIYAVPVKDGAFVFNWH